MIGSFCRYSDEFSLDQGLYGDMDNDNKTIFERKEPNKCPSLSLVLSGCSHGGSLLCPTSGSEAEESFLQDYW